MNSGGLGEYRTVSADTLSVWAQRAVQCCSASSECAPQIDAIFSDDDAEKIFSFVCDYWTDSGAALGNALKELFVKLISLLAKVRTTDQLVRVLHAWTERILKFSKTQRVLYFTLEILVKHVGGGYVLQQSPEFSSQALLYMGSNALANPIGKTLFALYSSLLVEMAGNIQSSKIPTEISTKWTNLWAPATRLALINPKTREHVQTYFLPQMFKKVPSSLRVFLEPFMNIQSDTPENEISVLVGCLKIGQESNILDLSQKDNKVISPEFLESLFYHKSPSLRISALSLAVTSPQGSKPIAPYVLDIIKRSIDNFFVESDPGFRNQFYGFMRQLIFRIRGSSYAMVRESRKLKLRNDIKRSSQLDDQVDAMKSFCIWFVDYLENCIRPGSPYQYLFTGILLITLLVQSGLDERVSSKFYEKQHIPFPFHVSLYNHRLVRMLIDNIANNYEDIRSGASKILKMAPLPVPYVESYTGIEAISSKVYKTISGMRGREGDAGARGAEVVFQLYNALPSENGENIAKTMEFFEELLENLEQQVLYAKEDLAVAVRKHPIHGYYSALRFIIENLDFKNFIINESEVNRWQGYVKRLTDAVFEIWNTVEAILCHDSPEGNLPEEFESNFQPSLEAQYGPATQVILSYSWRAVKESTSLLNALLERLPNNPTIFPNSLVLDSGEVILTQLATVRHRGAFSSVYPTFISCCKRCNRTKGLEDQPAKWLSDNLALIKIKAQYITRRSGGLPYLITAVLTAETDPKKPLLYHTFNTLYKIATSPAVSSAEEKLDLPQVHAFNCIKALFIETELSSASAFFVDQALEIAITSFSHPIWSIRNCAVMLFTALQNRLFGTAKVSSSKHVVSTVPARLFFSKYKTVRQVLLNILQQHVENLKSGNSDSSHIETVFPVLSLLARLEGTNGYEGLNEFNPLILVCLKSKIWKTREMAARTLPPLLNEQDIFQFSIELLDAASCKDHNSLHGACLAVLNMVNRAQEKYDEQRLLTTQNEDSSKGVIPSSFIRFLFTKFDEFVVTNHCAETARAYFRILSSIYVNLLKYPAQIPSEFDSVFIPYCFSEWAGKKNGLNAVERCLQSELANIALISIFDQKKPLNQKSLDYINKLVMDSRYEVQQMVITFLNENLETLSLVEAANISSSCWDLFNVADWDLVKGPAARLFSKIQTISSCAAAEAENYWTTLYSTISPQATEEINESCLEALGIFTAQLFVLQNGLSNDKTENWLSLIRSYSHENQAYPARNAAMNSLLSFLKIVNENHGDKHSKFMPHYLDALFQLQSFLTDDDEDIRDNASAFTSELLKLPFISTSVHCEKVLLNQICELATTNSLVPYLLKQLFTPFVGDGTAFSTQLQVALTDDDLLFSFEKQNLFRDELRIVAQYHIAIENVLLALDDQSRNLFNKGEFSPWLHDTLSSILKLLSPQSQSGDGVLGWTKDSEIFLCLYRAKMGITLGQKLNWINSEDQILVEQIARLGSVVKLHDMLLL